MRRPGEELHLACSADGAYVGHCAAMIESALRRVDAHAMRIHFLHGPRLSRRTRERLTGMVDAHGGAIEYHEVPDAAVAGLPVGDLWSATIWYRIFLPELLPDAGRVLYLDADTLVVGSLSPLLDFDLDGQHVAAVTNVPERHRMGHAQAIGLPRPDAYFNSGVLLMNLEQMRRDGMTEALVSFGRVNGPHLLWPDQDALNVVLGPKRVPLPPRWNRMNSLDFSWSDEFFSPAHLDEAKTEPAILHFEGPAENKPWHILATPAHRRRYDEHRRETPWPRYRTHGLTPANLARRLARHLRS